MIDQTPPAFSAIKIGGKRAYSLARAGEEVEIPSRKVEVTRFEQLWRDGDRAAFSIACGSGTYVRSLIAELGDAYCEELRRTSIGPFEIAEASDVPLTIVDTLSRLVPKVALGDDDARRLGFGQHPPVPPGFAERDGVELLCVDEAGAPVALAEARDGALVPSVGFRP
jgi:tRNA pseudouridine55 synthase